MSDLVTTMIGESLIMTALLIGVVLVVRRPVAALFGPRLAYALWLIPALRLVLPPVPGGEMVVAASAPLPLTQQAMLPPDAALAQSGLATSSDWAALMVPAFGALWLCGVLVVLGLALYRHRAWAKDLKQSGTALDRVDGVDVVMSASVDGPIAVGLWRPLIVVPADFFARYNRAERELAIAHELAHHRAGDLWANAAALMVLAAQWFNPLAWRAVQAFRFDQEAACDARVMAALAPERAGIEAHSYACAIAKSVAGPRLLLAAPMTSGTKVKERLHMLTHNPRLGVRPAIGRLLLGGATLGALALTISTLPARVVFAAEPEAMPAPPQPPAPPEPPAPPTGDGVKERQVMIFHSDIEADDASGGGNDGEKSKPRVHRIILNSQSETGDQPRVMMFGGEDGAKGDVTMVPTIRMAMPFFGPNSDELRATLKEQGIDDAKADAIIKQMEEKHAARMPRAPRAPRAMSWSSHGGEAMAIAKCKDGETPRIMVDRSSEISGGKSKVRMVQCGNALPLGKQVEAMKKARDRMAAQTGTGMSAEIRASVVADLDKAIVELESKKKD